MSAVLTPDLLLHAYASGIFPMSESRDDPELFWVDPKRRGIIPMESFHVSRSLARRIRRMTYDVRLNTAFADVVSACAERPETWINDTIFVMYKALFEAGYAHSIELFDRDSLIGGVYGVAIGKAFFGESMFSRKPDGSKIALAYLVTHLRRQGFTLFDTQFVTPHLTSLGAKEISRAAYRKLLDQAIGGGHVEVDTPLPTAQEVVQRRTQTS